MAANKFATMLHRNTNKITLILIYAVLEWILIILLLLNSLFSYLIIKFADYFGLKTPCLWCSRVDHIFEPRKKPNSYRDLLCEAHATEISKLGYCSNHRKLVESQYMCEDCSSSLPNNDGVSKNFAFFPWMKELGVIQSEGKKIVENGEVGLKCSCCGVSMDSKSNSPYIVIKPAWDVLDYTQKGNLIADAGNDDDDHIEEGDCSGPSRSDFLVDRCEDEREIEKEVENQMISGFNGRFGFGEEEAEEDCSVSNSNSELKEFGGVWQAEKEPIKEDNSNVVMEDPWSDETINSIDDSSLEIIPQHLEFFVGQGGCRLIPVELIDSTTEENQSKYRIKEEDHENNDIQEANLGSVLQDEARIGESEEEPRFAVIESVEMEENENSLVIHEKDFDLMREVCEQVAMTQAAQTPPKDVDDDVQAPVAAEANERDSDDSPQVNDDVQAPVAAEANERDSDDSPPVFEEMCQFVVNETEVEVSIGTDIPDLDPTDEIQTREIPTSYQCIHEDPSTSSANLDADNDHGCKQTEEETIVCKTITVEMSETSISNHFPLCSELNEIEDDKVPDTPTSTESLHHLHKKLLLLEKRESGTEESLDGSVISEFEGGEGVVTVDRLTSALRAERKALHALYTELEEERSASAVAASQTMAMINRLQEEKAAMQMEALQYQRMMEEQSEYDQEALQLLNELMVKREREKHELEKEIEIYRKKVLDYESKEKMKMLRKSKDGSSSRSGTSSASCSHAEDSDGLSIDLNQEAKEEDGFYGHQESGNHNTPVEAVLNLEESLANFEEERMSILEQLKVLEEKLFTLADEEENHIQDIKPIDHLCEENGKHLDENSDCDCDCDCEVNGDENGFSKEMNGKHEEKRTMGATTGKRLLPLFDEISAENENGMLNGHGNGMLNGHGNGVLNGHENGVDSVTRIKLGNKKLAVEEEVDHLYERLQALEGDREFLKHCISSLKKGDEGMDLLNEILHHLRDLRNVELRVRNLDDHCVLV
ncbi:myosin-binding protein 3-like isoform X2 [Cornus florida]|uniref:myosin-binding protein 3-like isoform X2 n=1 Tax=Cornus florida TaxID=4283 RepID=UPI00289B8E04|nr:myosin-binding protein 3-like isoform X2 [Cornus florida]